MPPASRRPIVTLTTDFGLQDHYVGTMKGVILGRCPEAHVIDISHEIPPFSIYAGAYAIDQAARYFPVGTVHVVVIDPGVGTARRAMLAEAGSQYFVAPDNGVLSMVLARDAGAKMRAVTNSDFFLDRPSTTFHGRDIFAPAAAALASGQARPDQLGPELLKAEILFDLCPVQIDSGHWRGRVLSVDRFGNAITNFKASDFPRLAGGKFKLTTGAQAVTEWRDTFAGASPGECFVYVGSSGYLELGMNQKRAAQHLLVEPGSPLEFHISGNGTI